MKTRSELNKGMEENVNRHQSMQTVQPGRLIIKQNKGDAAPLFFNYFKIIVYITHK